MTVVTSFPFFFSFTWNSALSSKFTLNKRHEFLFSRKQHKRDGKSFFFYSYASRKRRRKFGSWWISFSFFFFLIINVNSKYLLMKERENGKFIMKDESFSTQHFCIFKIIENLHKTDLFLGLSKFQEQWRWIMT